MVMGSNKNLGQCVIKRVKYKWLVWEYLKDNSTYRKISELEANKMICNATLDFFHLARNAQEEKDMKT